MNRRATKVQLWWNFERSSALSDEEKERIRERLASFINADGLLAVEAQEERSQAQNRRTAMDKLNALVSGALAPEKERIATRPTRASRERRMEEKRAQAQKKRMRSHKTNNHEQ